MFNSLLKNLNNILILFFDKTYLYLKKIKIGFRYNVIFNY